MLRPNRTASTYFQNPEQTPLGQLAQARRAQAGARSDSGFFLMDNVDAALASRLALVDQARRTIDLQYYAIHADASSEVILQRLREAARRGVRVRILIDDFNTVGEDAQVLRLAWAGLGVVYVVWGSTYLAIRFTVTSMPPLLSGGLRFTLIE